jgi:hypothetical protein
MAYKQKGCTPVTAKVQKTTKGGMVQQPLLNMGAPVKMKSPAKQGAAFGETYQKKMAEKRQADKQGRAEADKNTYNKKIEQYKKDVELTSKPYKKSDGTREGRAFSNNWLDAQSRSRRFSDELFEFDKKNNPSRTEGFNTAKDYAKSKINKSKDKLKDRKVSEAGEAGWAADDEARKNKTGLYDPKNKEDIVDPPKPDKVTGKSGSDLRRQQYDKLGWKYDSTINVPKERKKVEAIKPNVEAKTVSMETKSEIVLPKKAVEVKNIEKAEKKIDVAENKETRATKVRAKGEKALAEGNKGKALRLKRREEGILKRAQKKRSQASKAIEPN